MSVEKLNPPNVPQPIAYYSNLAVIPPSHKLLMLSGQIGNRLDGSMPDALDEQFAQALKNIVAIVESQGGGSQDVARLTCYVTERPESYDAMGKSLRETFPAPPPAMTFIIVAGLAGPHLKVEIEAVAAVAEN